LEAIPTRNITLTLNLNGFMIYSTKKNLKIKKLLLLFIHPNVESYHELIYQVIE
jgi:hypothetical protein